MGEQYQAYFKSMGIHLQLVETHGSQENLQRLIDRKDPIQAAFVQGGLINVDNLSGVESLGSVDFEPVWVFYRHKLYDEKKHILDRDIAKLKINIGPVSSGTHTQALNILKLNSLQTNSPNLLSLSNADGAAALERGEIDAIILVDGFESHTV